MKISLIIPSYNNLQHLKNAYISIQKHTPKSEVILLDDGSTDGTWEWIQDQDCIKYRSEERVGHTILYDVGIEMASNDVVGILHADMIIGPNYVENLLKHLKPGTVVCATRIEPPLHPEGKEKIIKDFGMDFDSLDVKSFEEFCLKKIEEHKDQTTKGMFAPWILFKEDFKSIGGHDPLFAPFPYEDSDIFQRWILAGYNLIQSRDAFVYHLTCRGHRWNKEIGKNDEEFAIFESKARRNYIRKWGSWIKNDEYQYPTVPPKYNIGYRVENCHLQLLEALEPWCDRIYVDELFKVIGRSHDYIEMEQENTSFDLSKRIHTLTDNDRYDYDDILVEINGNLFTHQDFQTLQQLPEILQDSGEEGSFELGNLKITISSLETYEKGLIVCSSQYVL